MSSIPESSCGLSSQSLLLYSDIRLRWGWGSGNEALRKLLQTTQSCIGSWAAQEKNIHINVTGFGSSEFLLDHSSQATGSQYCARFWPLDVRWLNGLYGFKFPGLLFLPVSSLTLSPCPPLGSSKYDSVLYEPVWTHPFKFSCKTHPRLFCKRLDFIDSPCQNSMHWIFSSTISSFLEFSVLNNFL